jgi:hypothetical protein
LRFFLGAGAAAAGAGGCCAAISGCICASERPKKGAEDAAAMVGSEQNKIS